MLARISNCMAPSSATPFGEIYSKMASNFSFSTAPTERIKFIPVFIFPTSDSSTLPLKIISIISAITAMVVPALKLFVSMTDLPSLTGISRIIPSMVDRISVLVSSPGFFVTPSLINCKLSPAASNSSLALLYAISYSSYLEDDIIPFSCNLYRRSSSLLVSSRLIRARLNLAFALFKLIIFGITRILAMRSSFLTLSPGSTKISSIMPEICGFISISFLGTMDPVATVFLIIFVIKGLLVSKMTGFFWDL